MFPIGDDNSQRKLTPWVNYLLIALNIFVFFYFQSIGTNDIFTLSFSTVPAEILSGSDIVNETLQPTPIPVYGTIITAMFMHGSVTHLLGNMLYLWIFGDNLENVMGHARYLIFYVLCGIIATFCHVYSAEILNNGLLIPSLGASGAISGVLGGYLLLFPRNLVRVFALAFVIRIPAFITLGLWIAMQIVESIGIINSGYEGGGVAYAAHIGGFIAGLILVKFFVKKQTVIDYRNQHFVR